MNINHIFEKIKYIHKKSQLENLTDEYAETEHISELESELIDPIEPVGDISDYMNSDDKKKL